MLLFLSISATPESIHTSSTKAIEISVRVWGSLRAKHLGWWGEGGGGLRIKNPYVVELWKFSGATQCDPSTSAGKFSQISTICKFA